MLGLKEPLQWKYDKTGLEIFIPGELQDVTKRPCKIAWVFRIRTEN
jgi:hypothetical protein